MFEVNEQRVEEGIAKLIESLENEIVQLEQAISNVVSPKKPVEASIYIYFSNTQQYEFQESTPNLAELLAMLLYDYKGTPIKRAETRFYKGGKIIYSQKISLDDLQSFAADLTGLLKEYEDLNHRQQMLMVAACNLRHPGKVGPVSIKQIKEAEQAEKKREEIRNDPKWLKVNALRVQLDEYNLLQKQLSKAYREAEAIMNEIEGYDPETGAINIM
jgi:hypothetical protein